MANDQGDLTNTRRKLVRGRPSLIPLATDVKIDFCVLVIIVNIELPAKGALILQMVSIGGQVSVSQRIQKKRVLSVGNTSRITGWTGLARGKDKTRLIKVPSHGIPCSHSDFSKWATDQINNKLKVIGAIGCLQDNVTSLSRTLSALIMNMVITHQDMDLLDCLRTASHLQTLAEKRIGEPRMFPGRQR